MAKEPVSAKVYLLNELDSAFDGLLKQLQAMVPLRESAGGWGPYEVVSHMSGWHTRAAERLRYITRGEEPPPPGNGESPDQLNVRYVAERRGRDSDSLMAELRSSFGDLRAAIESVPEQSFWRGKEGEEDSLAYFIAYVNGTGHYEEHLAELGGTA
jgi:hypothetical protein